MDEYTDTNRSFTRNIVLNQVEDNFTNKTSYSLTYNQLNFLLKTYLEKDELKNIETRTHLYPQHKVFFIH